MFSKKFSIFLGFFLLPTLFKVSAGVVINEFTSTESTDWIEVINTATESADLNQYYFVDNDEHKKDLSGSLGGGSIIAFTTSLPSKDGDILSLKIQGSDIPLDEIAYGNEGGLCAPADGQSIGRKPDGTGSFIRFESSSRDASNNNSTEAPCPTDTPTKTLTPTRTPSVTKTPTSPPQSTVTHTPVSTNTQSPVQDPKPTSTSKPTAFRTPTPKKTPTPMSKLGETESGMYVLGESTGPSVPSSTPSTGPRSSPSYTPLIITFLLVGIGLGIIAAVLAWQKHQELKHE